jgi:hypothetical protein
MPEWVTDAGLPVLTVLGSGQRRQRIPQTWICAK